MIIYKFLSLQFDSGDVFEAMPTPIDIRTPRIPTNFRPMESLETLLDREVPGWATARDIGAVNEVLTQLGPVALMFEHNQVLQTGTLTVEDLTAESKMFGPTTYEAYYAKKGVKMRKQQIERIRGPRVDRQLPECPICFETYGLTRAETKPRILHCGHTLCNQCIRGMMAAETTHRLYCPLCRFSCMVIEPEYLPLNWALF
ncbi:unnamed protein product [Caenorhabditis brenneri]